VRVEGNVPSSARRGSAAATRAQVGEFGVATGGGVWVAAGDLQGLGSPA